ncbi:protein of unknown function [Ectopseudomonas oleovorans]|nr:protein of unknown function [Pseudomonas oleovorans]
MINKKFSKSFIAEVAHPQNARQA